MDTKNRMSFWKPVLLSVCLVAGAGCSKPGEAPAADAGNAGNGQQAAAVQKEAARVSVETVEIRVFENSVEVQGNLSAKNYANVSARIPGTLTAIYVSEGEKVTAGRTKLFQVDSMKLKNAYEISRQDYAVAEQGVNVAEASIEQIDAQLHKMEVDLKRLTGLYENEVVSKDDLEKVQSGYDQLIAGKKQAESALELSKERLKQAGLALKISEKDYNDATIYAPISGRVSHKFAEPGEMAAPGHPIVRIEDTTILEASAFLPSEYYGLITEGGTKARLEVSGIDMIEKAISYKSPTINPKLRTFEVKAIVENGDRRLAPGAMVTFSAIIDSREAPGVPSDCIQERGGKSTVFVADGETASLREVETGYEAGGYTEIIGGVKEGDRVIVKGYSFIDNGDEISISGEAE